MASEKKSYQQKFMHRAKRQAAEANLKGKEHIKRNLLGRLQHIENIRLLIFEWALLVTALILLAITQSFWFVNSYADDSYTDGGTYSEATIGTVNSLNPIFAVTNSEKALSRLLFATLATVDYSGHPGIGLAESITSSDDGQTWTGTSSGQLKPFAAPSSNPSTTLISTTSKPPRTKTAKSSSPSLARMPTSSPR